MKWNQTSDRLVSAMGGGDEAKSMIPDIVRLVEDPNIEKSIELDEISIALEEDTKITTTNPSPKAVTAGITYPLIRINDFVFSSANIKDMVLSCTGFLPTISVRIEVVNSRFMNRDTPKDGDILSLFMHTSTDALEEVRCDFIIINSTPSTVHANAWAPGSSMTVNGVLFIPSFNATKINTFAYIGTSREVLKEIAKEFHIGFAFNDEDNTDDCMNWISCNQTMDSFIKDMLAHSWKDNTSFYESWIDIYYNLVHVNINKYMLDSQNEKEFDVTFYTNILSNMETADFDTDSDNAIAMIKIFTNNPNFRKTPFFIKSWAPTNKSTTISFNTGYNVDVYSFIHNQNVLNDSQEDAFLISNCVPSFDKEKAKTHILLRGRAKYDENYSDDEDRERVNYDFVNTYVKKRWYGISYMVDTDEQSYESNDTWSGNVHQNYAIAPYHNSINISELNKMYITIECEGLNLQVQRGEYVPVLLMFENEAEYMQNNETEDRVNGTDVEANRMYSGYYYVSDVVYKYKYDNDDSFSGYSTIFTLKKREWPAPEKIAVENENKGEE